MPMTTLILWLIGIALAVVTLPVVLELALLSPAFFLPRRRSDSRGGFSSIRLAVVIPAHNEEFLIARCVESLRVSAAGTGTRILAIAHNCSDQTALRAQQAGAEVLVYDDPQAVGKGFALLHGFEHIFASRLDAVLVLDADSIVSENLIAVVSRALASSADVVQCRYEMESLPNRPMTRLTALAFRGFNLIRVGGRDRLGLSAGILGNGFAIRRAIFEQIPYNALSVVEDLEYHLQLVSSGKRVEFLEEAVVSSCATSSSGADLTQRSRWEGGRASVARRWILPLARQAMSGRPRLLEPLLELSSLPLGYAALALSLAICIPLTWLRIYSIFAFTVIAFHVLAAAWRGPNFNEDIRILLRVPGYILWKLRILPHLLRGSSVNAAWIRTERQPVPANASFDKTGLS